MGTRSTGGKKEFSRIFLPRKTESGRNDANSGKPKPQPDAERQVGPKTDADPKLKLKSKSASIPPEPQRASEPERRPVGRPRALDTMKKENFLAFISAGGSRKKAAQYVGVGVTTIANEAKRDEEFAKRLELAEASCYMHHLQIVAKAGQEDWRASAFILERKFPEEFGKRTDVNVGGQPNNPVEIRPQINEYLVHTREDVKRARELGEWQKELQRREDELEGFA